MGNSIYSRRGRLQDSSEPRQVFHRAARLQPMTIVPPKPSDAIKPGTCVRCGFTGEHATPIVCIEALRDRLAKWE